MKSAESCSNGFSEENGLTFHNFIHIHNIAQGVMVDNPKQF